VSADLAVVGFDGTEESAYSLPSLTTVAPDKSAMARRAVELVHRRINAPGVFPPRGRADPFTLRIRESTTGRFRAPKPCCSRCRWSG
jgi:LacI family repressor for deo operon, udp, cdd, tsx, nupC, and nupG